MERSDVAKRLTDIAAGLVSEDKEATVETPKRTKEGLLLEAREALHIAAEINGKKVKKAAGRVQIDKLPGFSPMQLKQAIDQVVSVRQEAQQIRTQYERVLAQLNDLDDKEKKGLADLKKAAAQVKQKERFCVEAENGLLEFTAFLQEKRPGVEQMLADPETSKFGDKAGDFFGRVGAKLGKDVQEAIAAIYEETKEDLTHTADAIRGLKVVAKTASIRESSMKKAGLADMAVSVKMWLQGEVDSLSKRILNFAGNIKRWVTGFVMRTKVVQKNTDNLLKGLNVAQMAIESALN